MYLFIPLATALVLVAVAAIAVPLLRSRPALAPVVWTAFACIAVVAVGSIGLYAALSGQSGHKSSATDAPATESPQSMVAHLAHRLKAQPNDLDGWLMLGRSYLVLREYQPAVHAYERALRLSGNNTQALLGEAQALILTDQTSLTGRAGDLIERALTYAPNDPHALFFGAMVALHRDKLQLARRRFERVLALNPPENIKHVIQTQIASIDQRLPINRLSATSVADSNATRPGTALIRVRLELAPALVNRAPRTAPLYVFVRDPKLPGPPLAVKRLTSHFPQTVVLRPTDSMVPGRAFTTGERVEVIARIAPSGNPLSQSGDLSGQTPYRVGHDGLAKIDIDHVAR